MAPFPVATLLVGSAIAADPAAEAFLSLDHDTRPPAGGPSPDAAVVIGIEHYTGLPDVPGALDDASAVRDWLLHGRGIDPLRVSFLPDELATSTNVARALRHATATTPTGGLVWIYFAGHGDTGHDGRGAIRLYPSRWGKDRVGLSLLEEDATRGGNRAVFLLEADFPELGGIAAPRPSDRAVEIYAARPGGTPWHLAPAQHGAFTWALLGALRGWAAGTDSVVTLDEAVRSVSATLAALTLPVRHVEARFGGDVDPGIPLVVRATEPAPDLAGLAAAHRRWLPDDGRAVRAFSVVVHATGTDGQPCPAGVEAEGDDWGTTPLRVPLRALPATLVVRCGKDRRDVTVIDPDDPVFVAFGPESEPAKTWSEVRVVHRVSPRFPATARDAVGEWSCDLRFFIGPDGVPTDVQVWDCPAEFEAPALEAARQWRFSPMVVDGVPRASRFALTVKFRR